MAEYDTLKKDRKAKENGCESNEKKCRTINPEAEADCVENGAVSFCAVPFCMGDG